LLREVGDVLGDGSNEVGGHLRELILLVALCLELILEVSKDLVFCHDELLRERGNLLLGEDTEAFGEYIVYEFLQFNNAHVL